MTAFYMFRLIFMTFRGQERFDTEQVHPHESPPSMIQPLRILAVLSVIGGVIVGIPPENGLFHKFVAHAFHHGHEAHHAFHFWPDVPLMLLSTLIALSGLYLAYLFYVQDPERPERLAGSFPSPTRHGSTSTTSTSLRCLRRAPCEVVSTGACGVWDARWSTAW